MKIIIGFLAVLSLQLSALAQIEIPGAPGINIIKLEEFYDGEGVIFPATYKTCPFYDSVRVGFTPSIEDIVAAEKIIKAEIEHQFLSDSIALNTCQNKLRTKYYRQYFGYLEPDGTKVIAIHFMDFTYVPFLYKYWKKILADGTGNAFGIASRFQWVNINKQIRYENGELQWN